MAVEPFKYLIQPVAIERDDASGRVVKEHVGQVVTVFTAEDAAQAVIEFEAAIKQLQEGAQHEPHQDNGGAEADPAERAPGGRVRPARPVPSGRDGEAA